jgi:hypothetical protein
MKLFGKPEATSLQPSHHRPTMGVVRLAWATILLAAPATVVEAFGGPVDATSVTVARVLGARHAIQGIVELATWPRWSRTGAIVDATHSLTAFGAGLSAARWRRIGLADGAVAATLAYAGWIGRAPLRGDSSRPEVPPQFRLP